MNRQASPAVRAIQAISNGGEWEIPRGELKLCKTIGTGSFGTVHAAEWRETMVAAKIMNATQVNIDELRVELEILSKVHHPNVVQFLCACTMDSPCMIVTEYMPNGSLDVHIKKGNMKKSTKLEIAKDISKALVYLHNRRPQIIIHRDVKPNNVLITGSFRAKLSDFGISSVQTGTSNTQLYEMTGETGTYRYMAPEVLKHKKYNATVDVWSFGMVLYHMFIDLPFKHLEAMEMMRVIASEKPIVVPEIGVLKHLIVRCIKRDATERMTSIEATRYLNKCTIEYKINCLQKEERVVMSN